MRIPKPPQATAQQPAPEQGAFLLPKSRLPLWAVEELQAYYKSIGITASIAEATADLAKLIDLHKLVLRYSPVKALACKPVPEMTGGNASSAPKTTYYSYDEDQEVRHDRN